jgi:uncharacterized protein YacL
MSRRLAARVAAFVVVGAIAAVVGIDINQSSKAPWPLGVLVGIAIICGVIAFIILPYVTTIPYRWVRDQIRKAEVSDLVAGAIGLVIGLIIAALLAIPLSQLTFFQIGRWLPTVVAGLCAYLGITIAVLRKEDFSRLTSAAFVGRVARRANREERDSEDEHDEHEEREEKTRLRERFGGRGKARNSEKILVDTSAIIDGRIADISQTGFITSTLVVPRFILEELQHIADSADSLKRNRGRRGLEILQRLKDSRVPIEISDADPENTPEVDGKLVKLARQWHCSIITNDFNLNRVAELQGVKVLNINELAHAVKPILLPGEEMQVTIMQDGKESGQGVGYLDDGTMIVVEGGKSFMGSTIEVTVTRVLQTVAGRMIFAHPKQSASNVSPVRRTGTA